MDEFYIKITEYLYLYSGCSWYVSSHPPSEAILFIMASSTVSFTSSAAVLFAIRGEERGLNSQNPKNPKLQIPKLENGRIPVCYYIFRPFQTSKFPIYISKISNGKNPKSQIKLSLLPMISCSISSL